ncbi:MAG: uroporphyrinogen-III synthase [Salinivirgaceae bacterium]|nr:uroporphyrinogen-III synthase [Salinivirgaceae bacterium]MBO7432864.1 uroporphyrinogen-III synthase [Salinivirgaceae bacterium]MBO7595100.1 uroporphyrinogen-III synthase [Salinivirgaceae bacterium]MBR5167946.1 uroporphyrinogen-III synthase [Salinivirgaceae bacterium]
MKIKKILVSQPKPTTEKSPYFDLADKYNLKIDFRPFITVTPIDAKEFRKEKVNILDHTAVIFTSKHAIDHLFRMCEEMRVVLPDDMKYFCTTESIALYLQKYITYRKRKIFFGTGTFTDLLSVLDKHKENKFLLPSSDKYKPEVIEQLKAHNIDHTLAILYQTVATDMSDIADQNYDIMCFFSPEGIKSLKTNFPNFEQNDIKIAAFGPTTAKAVENANLRLDIKAPLPEAPSMPAALELFIKDMNKACKKN